MSSEDLGSMSPPPNLVTPPILNLNESSRQRIGEVISQNRARVQTAKTGHRRLLTLDCN